MAALAAPTRAPAPLPDWLSEENDVAARQQGVLRAADAEEMRQRAEAAAAEAAAKEAAAQPRRPPPPPRGSKFVIPEWLNEDLDPLADEEGLLIPEPKAGPPVARGPKAAKALIVPPPAPPAQPQRVAPPDPLAPAEDAGAMASRHEAVVQALSGPEGPAWDAPLPAKTAGDAPYPLWLAPELDALKTLHPGALGPGETAPPKPPPQPTGRVFALRPANPGDQIVVMSHPGHAEFGAGGPRAAQHGGISIAAKAAAAATAGAGNGTAARAAEPARGGGSAIKPPKDVWTYSWEIAAAEEDSNGGIKGPPELPTGGNSGPTLAARIAAVVVSHELDARALWRN